jgi:RNA polymerase sigma-70 factor (ECF subfamily)
VSAEHKVLAERDYGRLLRPMLVQAAGYARAILRNRHDAEDAVQQAALRGLERLDPFDEPRPFKGWWFAILRNCCIDVLRTRRAADTCSLDDKDVPDSGSAGSPDWESLSQAIERLSAEHREILRLRYFGGLSYRELAETLSIPQGTVMSRLHLARKALAAAAKEEAL